MKVYTLTIKGKEYLGEGRGTGPSAQALHLLDWLGAASAPELRRQGLSRYSTARLDRLLQRLRRAGYVEEVTAPLAEMALPRSRKGVSIDFIVIPIRRPRAPMMAVEEEWKEGERRRRERKKRRRR